MSVFAAKVAMLTSVPEDRLERLAGGDLSEILLLRRPDGRCTVAKGGPAVGTEAAMLRALAAAGIATPAVEGEHDGALLLEHIFNDGVFTSVAWADIGTQLRLLHDVQGEDYGWPVDYRLGTVELNNGPAPDWPRFWGERRLLPTASLLDRPWRARVDAVAARLPELLPASPPVAHLHGDLWTGNILVADGALAALIDPACYFGHNEADLAMLTLFDVPPEEFWGAYGPLDPGAEARRPVYQLFPALVHLRLFGASYAPMVERLLDAIEASAAQASE
ncbi:MAG: fructosamine kinase family protein [Pseudomonadota bacterium]|nr:fructosamine kinase family protein [Pseudomonadota bacterium]